MSTSVILFAPVMFEVERLRTEEMMKQDRNRVSGGERKRLCMDELMSVCRLCESMVVYLFLNLWTSQFYSRIQVINTHSNHISFELSPSYRERGGILKVF